MKTKKNSTKKYNSLNILIITSLLIFLCGTIHANSEFNTPLAASNQTINFTYVPEYPNLNHDDLEGNVTGVAFDDHRVAVYIRMGELWWIKPYYASPLTTINPDGTWTCDITTGGYDYYTTAIAAYLLPVGIEPPICAGCCGLPEISGAVDCILEELIEPRTISFANYDWKIKRTDFRVGPGPNFFSDKEEDVWVDDEGRLHLTINEHDGKWYCTEVILNTSLGYGTYIFQTHGRVDIIDPMMVLGLFTWDDGANEVNYREIDIEFARWGNADEYTNAQYVIQPCSQCPGCDDRCTRFRVNLTDEDCDLTHYLDWRPGTVEIKTYCKKIIDSVSQSGSLVYKWTHSSEYIPEPGDENVRFNFWLHEGNAPSDNQSDEVVITNFTWQEEAPHFPEQVVTNLINYPITGCFVGAEEVRINDVPVTMDEHSGFREDVVLNTGLNTFTIDVIRNSEISRSICMEINFDPALLTENHTLLYSRDDPAKPETIVLDLDEGYILGVLYNINIVSATHDGRYVVDTKGNVYHTLNHTVVGERLPFSKTTNYPVFSNDDSLCYSGSEKVRFADRTLISDQIPVEVDGRYATLLPDNMLIQGSCDHFRKINLTNDEVIDETTFNRERELWGTSAVAPNSNPGFVTSYSWSNGALDIIDLETGNIITKFDHLSDHMGQISFSNDQNKAFVGSYGNSYYGEGGIYVIDVDTQTMLSYFEQFGASSVEVGPDGLVYISSGFVDHYGDGTVTHGFKDGRGINVLLLDGDNELQFIKTYYLNYEHRYSTKPLFFIKPGGAPTELPDLEITDIWANNSTIYYQIMNNGKCVAQAGYHTSLSVDSIETANVTVPVQLAFGESYTGSFVDYSWSYSPPVDNLTVCADSGDVVSESDELNNCLVKILRCGDVDSNGIVNIMDVRLLMNHVADPGEYPVDTWVSDVEGDNDVDLGDVQLLLKHVFDPNKHQLTCS